MPSDHKLILASASPARLELLQRIDMAPALVVAAEIDETPGKNELPRQHVLRLAEGKARAVVEKHHGAYIVAADTIAACGRRIIGKAADEREARAILALLSGRRHRVWSGLCVIAPDGRARVRAVCTSVKFKRLAQEETDAYIASGQWRGKSGCYGIQGRAGGFIEWINGSFSNVIGLPLAETRAMLTGLGYPA